MGKLKPGWRKVKFGEVVRQAKSKVNPETSGLERYVAGEHMDTDDLRIRRWGEIGNGYLGPAFHARFRPGQVLYGSRRTYLRKVAIADFEGICANTTLVLESADPRILLPELLPFVMQTDAFHEHSRRESKGSVNPYVNFSDLAWYEFALPCSLDEQRRIACTLEAPLLLKEELKKAKAAQQEVYESYSLHVFAPCLSGTRRLPRDFRHPAFDVMPWDQIVEEDAPICYGIVQVGSDNPRGVPTLAIKDLDGNFTNGVHRTSAHIEQAYERSRVREGDVVVAIKGTIGPVAVVPKGFQGNISRDLARVRLKSRAMLPRFFLHLYRSPAYRRYVEGHIVGSTRAELSIGVLRALEILVPALKTQTEVVRHLEALSEAGMEIDRRDLHLKTQYAALLRTVLSEA